MQARSKNTSYLAASLTFFSLGIGLTILAFNLDRLQVSAVNMYQVFLIVLWFIFGVFAAITYRRSKDLFHPMVFYLPTFLVLSVGILPYIELWGVPAGYAAMFGQFDSYYFSLLLMILLGGGAFVVGALLSQVIHRFVKVQDNGRHVEYKQVNSEMSLARISQIGLILGTLLLWYIILSQGIIVWFTEYGVDQFEYNAMYYLYQIAQFIWFPSFLLYMACNLSKPNLPKLRILAYILSFLLLLILKGDRSALFYVALSVAVQWDLLRRPIQLKWLLLGLVFVAYAAGTIASIRGGRLLGYEHEIAMENSVRNIVGISAGVGGVTLATMTLVPSVIPFQNGATLITSIKNLVPGIFFDVRENPSLLFHQTYAPLLEDHGFGFSVLAEGYMNWGIWGVIPLMLMVGVILGITYEIARREHTPISVTVYSIIVFQSFWFIRSDSTVYVKSIVYALIVIAGYKLLTGKKERGISFGIFPRGDASGN